MKFSEETISKFLTHSKGFNSMSQVRGRWAETLKNVTLRVGFLNAISLERWEHEGEDLFMVRHRNLETGEILFREQLVDKDYAEKMFQSRISSIITG